MWWRLLSAGCTWVHGLAAHVWNVYMRFRLEAAVPLRVSLPSTPTSRCSERHWSCSGCDAAMRKASRQGDHAGSKAAHLATRGVLA
jgi:hypothetical protein